MSTFSSPIYELTGITTNICNFDTIGLVEYDNTVNDTGYTYSGLTLVLGFIDFTSHFDTTGHTYSNYILNNDVYEYTGVTGELHYFEIYNFYLGAAHYVDPLLSPLTEEEVISGFTTNIIHCTDILDGLTGTCCPTQQVLSNLPVVMITNEGGGTDNCDDFIARRTPLGWTLDFVFNKNGDTGWTESVFWYTGVRDEYDIENYADNGLSFRFTDDGKIAWMAYRFSGYCDTLSTGYTEMFYIDSGTTDNVLCSGGTSTDFNITITFERYYEYDTECKQANEGGWNDLLWWTGTTEELNKKWTDERNKRLGTLKIFHNGKTIFKLKNFEELVLSERGFQPFTHIVGGGVTGSGGIHEGCFPYTIQRASYYEAPANFIEITDHYITLSGIYDITECADANCVENIVRITPSSTVTPSVTPSISLSPTPSISISPTPTPSSTPYLEAQINFATATEDFGTIGITNPQDRTFDITFSYSLNANCSTDGMLPNQSITSLSGSTDYGSTIFFIDSISSYIPAGSPGTDSQDKNGTFTLNGITQANFEGIYIMGDYECTMDPYAQGGVITVTITSVIVNDGIANIVCDNIYRIGCGMSPELLCGPQVTPSITPSVSVTSSITPSVSITPSITPSISITPTITPSVTPSFTPTPSMLPPAFELTFDNIINVPVSNASSVSDWNTFFDLPSYGSSFTSVLVDGNTVKLYGGSGIIIKNALFEDDTHIISVIDNASCVIAIGNSVFNQPFAGDSHLATAIFPDVTTVGDRAFRLCVNLTTITLPSCTALGPTVNDDLVFHLMIGNTITLTIPLALMTAGHPPFFDMPDEDIQYLQANNTVTIITV